MAKVTLEVDEDIFLPVYHHTVSSTYDIEFLYGSRDSGKSRHIAMKLLLKCLGNKKFKCPLIRKVANTVKDSQWAMLKSVAEEWKMDHMFRFIKSPLEIHCVNGGQFLARGMDEPKKIKSLTDPTDAWIEEGADLEVDDWTIITTSLRSNTSKAQIWFSFNPDVAGIYQEHWLYKQYFAHTTELSFTHTTTTILDDGTEAKVTYRTTHSTFYNNPYCPPERRAIYENLINTSQYYYLVYAKGLWGTKQTGGEFIRSFRVDKHVHVTQYNPEKTVHISIDSNVMPYIALTAWQLEKTDTGGWLIDQVDEFPAGDPDNTASRAGQKIVRWLRGKNYTGSVYLYGDRSTKSRNNIDDSKRSFFQIVEEQIRAAGFRTVDKMLNYAPAPHSIADFINAILDGQIPALEIRIGKNCHQTIADIIQTKTDKDGNMLKAKVPYPGEETGSFEKNGHLTDTFKDFMVQAFNNEYTNYTNRHKKIHPGGITSIQRVSKIRF